LTIALPQLPARHSLQGESDYRYFPEPDIPPLRLPRATVEAWRGQLAELPAEKRLRYRTQYKLSEADAETITDDQVRLCCCAVHML
jgi:aspartyl-tRNA(Asn)/glutamyl-tRNA(Gln) amidotransferase subunit B